MSSSLPETMKAVAIKGGAGPISALYIDESTPVPSPTKTQALVKIKAFALNRMDLSQREGKYPVPAHAPKTLGVEFSGTIVSFGSDNNDHETFKIGDEVFGLTYGGAYAEYVAVSTRMLIHKPSELSWEECAGIPEVWITATQALYFVGDYQKGDSVLWHAGASSVSIAGIQLAKADGASAVYVTTSTKDKIDFCKKLGATEGVNYKSPQKQNWAEDVLEYTKGKGVDVVIDFVGADYFSHDLEVMARDGRVVLLGLMSGGKVKGDVDIGRILLKRLRIQGSTLRSRDEEYQGKLRDKVCEIALPKLKSGEFKVYIEKVFKMEEIQKAHELLAGNQTMGKIICTVY